MNLKILVWTWASFFRFTNQLESIPVHFRIVFRVSSYYAHITGIGFKRKCLFILFTFFQERQWWSELLARCIFQYLIDLNLWGCEINRKMPVCIWVMRRVHDEFMSLWMFHREVNVVSIECKLEAQDKWSKCVLLAASSMCATYVSRNKYKLFSGLW